MLIATNHLGPMLLTLLLLPNLKAAGARIVNVASGAHDMVPLSTSLDDLLGANVSLDHIASSELCRAVPCGGGGN